jgi:hypothetical protein
LRGRQNWRGERMALLGEYCKDIAKGRGGKEPDIMKLDIDAIIEKAVERGIQIGKSQAEQRPKDTYKATEVRLYALPDLKDKVKMDKQYLEEFCYSPVRRSTDIVRFQRSGSRLDVEDIEAAIKQDRRAQIAADEFEIKTIEEALTPLTSDQYYLVISGRYFNKMTDEEIAEKIPCDVRTVQRNRGRLVHRIAIRLYGSEAI